MLLSYIREEYDSHRLISLQKYQPVTKLENYAQQIVLNVLLTEKGKCT